MAPQCKTIFAHLITTVLFIMYCIYEMIHLHLSLKVHIEKSIYIQYQWSALNLQFSKLEHLQLTKSNLYFSLLIELMKDSQVQLLCIHVLFRFIIAIKKIYWYFFKHIQLKYGLTHTFFCSYSSFFSRVNKMYFSLENWINLITKSQWMYAFESAKFSYQFFFFFIWFWIDPNSFKCNQFFSQI